MKLLVRTGLALGSAIWTANAVMGVDGIPTPILAFVAVFVGLIAVMPWSGE